MTNNGDYNDQYDSKFYSCDNSPVKNCDNNIDKSIIDLSVKSISSSNNDIKINQDIHSILDINIDDNASINSCINDSSIENKIEFYKNMSKKGLDKQVRLDIYKTITESVKSISKEID